MMATEQDSDAQKKLAWDLHEAVVNDDVTKVRSLLGQGAYPNHQLYWSDEWADKVPPLHRACYEGYLEIVKTLVTHGARTDKGDGKTNGTPLHWACWEGHKEVVQYLKEVGCSTDVRDWWGRTPLHWACVRGHIQLVKYLVEELKCDVDVRNKWGATPLHWACWGGHIQLVKYLVEELKCDVDVTDDNGKTPLDYAVEWGKTEIADYLKPLVSTPEPDTPNGSEQLPSTSSSDDPNLTSSTAEVLFDYEKTQDDELSLMVGDIIQDVVTVDEGWCEGTLNGERGLFPVNFVKMRPAKIPPPAQPASEPPVVRDGGGAIKSRRAKVAYSYVAESPDELSLEPGQIVEVIAEEEEGWCRGRLNNKEGVFPSNFIEFIRVQAEPPPEPVDIQNPTYLKKLDELMTDKNNTIELHYLKTHFIGPSGIGKTTTRQRLVGSITNLSLLPEDQRKRCSTLLAECEQVLAFVDKSGTKLEFKASSSLEEETQFIFSYLMSCEPIDDSTVSPPKEEPTQETTDPKKQTQLKIDETATAPKETVSPTDQPTPEPPEKVVKVTTVDVGKVVSRLRSIVGSGEYTKELLNKVLLNLVDIGGQPGFVEMFPFLSKGAGIFLVFFRLDKDLDDMCQVSYERGKDKITPYDSTYTSTETLSQILSAISHHTKIDSDIDREQCSKLGNLGSAKPVATLIGTFKDELTMQIKVDLLYEKYCHSAIYKSDSTTASKSDGTTASKSDGSTASKSDGTTANKSDGTTASESDSTTASESDGTTANKSDGTTASESDSTTASESDSTTASKSDSTTASKSDSTTASKSDRTTASKSNGTTASKSDSTTASESLKENEQKKAIRNILTQQKSDEHANVSAEDMAAIEQTVSQHLNSDTFNKDVQNRLEKKLTEKNEALTKITSKFEDLLSHPKDKKFIAVDNYEGTDSDMEPLREHLHGLFSSYFKDAKLRIRPQQLLFGVVLRKEFDIVSMEECIRIGTEGLKMREEEVRFTVWYLDRYVGALIYHPEIKDKDGWFGNFVICNPQVVFNSLSVLVVNPLLELHSEKSIIQFKEAERRNWILKGQFSLKTITRCHSEENQSVKKDQLIPVEKLLILLEHSHLLAKITTVVKEGLTTEKDETTFFIPAILKCASREELTKPPPTGIDTPSPIKITFDPQYVPIGVFCAMISELVSRGSKGKGILGMTWKLATDTSVKRNLVSFHIDESAKHFVTLIAHVDSYEIRIIRQNRNHTMHELCSYVLSTLLLVMKDISPLLTPIIAFDCYCGTHEDGSKLCLLTTGADPCFKCTSEVSLSPHQDCWFAEEVSLGDDVFLLALPFAEDLDPSLSFKWRKRRPRIGGTENELEFKASSKNGHFKGFISCEISKNQKAFLTVYHCLKESVEDTSSSETDELFADVKEVIKEIRSDWYSLAIELDIDYATRKSLEKDYRWVEPCFEAMLTHWVKRSSPSPSWSALVRALESPAIARGDIATTIKTKATSDISPDICPLTHNEGLSVDHHLRVVRTAAWEVRGTWRPLGEQLGVNEGTLDAIKRDYQNESGVCFTKLLEQWLTGFTPAPTLGALIHALKSPVISRGDIAQQMESKLTKLASQ
ncbi:uncharacterized protein LOC135350490 isoform X3 [Halichondria panicea]|uniref:uncharacterized protein LOC135350490 isoform X3 n=1 Tax=Halichondria panicea TaxID=6063 RepID=UPI00312BC303